MLDVIMHDILGTPAILVGLFAFIGLLIQKNLAPLFFQVHSKQLWALSFLVLVPLS